MGTLHAFIAKRRSVGVKTRSSTHTLPQAVQDGGRIHWGSGPAEEPPRYTGLDFIMTREGKISALYVFLDSPPV
jgi:hypothetical protein